MPADAMMTDKNPQQKPRFIFVTGGVVSSLGKGVAAASIAVVLQAHGYKVRCRKFDPYLNVDAGTLSPYRHGEVFVTNDGAEADLDLGHYERFTGVDAKRSDAVTAGQIYQTVIRKERRGDYDGRDVQVVPHVTDAIKEAMQADLADEDFVIVEIGGTIGDIEGLPFIEAIRQMGQDLGPSRTLYVHLTLLPYIAAAGELKTKPTQHSVRELQSHGIQPNIILCRADRAPSEDDLKKIALYCNVPVTRVFPALDVDTIYAVPQDYAALGVDQQILQHFSLATTAAPQLQPWRDLVQQVRAQKPAVTIALVGKYNNVPDSYKSLTEALTHGGLANNLAIKLLWVDSEQVSATSAPALVAEADAILVPGGFGARGTEGKIFAAQYARENGVPYLGICLGLQMAVLECARHLAGITDATSSEFDTADSASGTPVIGLMSEWRQGDSVITRQANDDWGGTMRLGAYTCVLAKDSRAAAVYGRTTISERHRHRYEVNIAYQAALAAKGLRFSGLSPDGALPELIEYDNHPWFFAVQSHPELSSRPLAPHPLFVAFIAAAHQHQQKRKRA